MWFIMKHGSSMKHGDVVLQKSYLLELYVPKERGALESFQVLAAY